MEARETYERLAHLRFLGGTPRSRLTPNERDALASVLLSEGKMTYAKMRKALKLGGRADQFRAGRGDRNEGLPDRQAVVQGRIISDPAGGCLSWAQKDAFVAKLLDEPDEETLVARLMREDGLSEEAARECATIPLADGYSRLGATANAAILEALKNERERDGRS